MNKRLWTAIQELLDAADYALGPLDRYSDYMDDPMGPVMIPNEALSAHSCLSEAVKRVNKLMPPNPSAPQEPDPDLLREDRDERRSMEEVYCRAEYLEDR